MENCACILHNLTFQLESESPQSFNKYYPQTEVQPQSKKGSPIGCFSPKSSKAQKQVQTSQLCKSSSPEDPPSFPFFFFFMSLVFLRRESPTTWGQRPLRWTVAVPSQSHADLSVPVGLVPERWHAGGVLRRAAEPDCQQGAGEWSRQFSLFVCIMVRGVYWRQGRFIFKSLLVREVRY